MHQKNPKVKRTQTSFLHDTKLMNPPLEIDSNWLGSIVVMCQNPSSEDRLGYLQTEIWHRLRKGGKRVSYLTLETEKEDGELEIEDVD